MTTFECRQSEESLQATMDDVFEHVGVPTAPINDGGPKNNRDYPPMDEGMKNRLRRFYEPYDEALRLLLGRQALPWSGGVRA